METLLSISEYVVYPSLIFMGLYIFVFVMWLFATDFYDAISGIFDECSPGFTALFVISGVNYLIGKYWLTWANPINYILNAVICIIIILTVVFTLIVFSEEFNKYCRKKRGKS